MNAGKRITAGITKLDQRSPVANIIIHFDIFCDAIKVFFLLITIQNKKKSSSHNQKFARNKKVGGGGNIK